ncbi:SH3 and multiple ankyrin repeat domains protein 2 isoform X2 [Condylostylus longicornis]|uniref:SH3 and multiple ankyrin repeat domains protein 2 isoform X2 n=1 Tax=Condylostylus longicornis TaxID=2530218 RepID=UPI00244E5451|nr:SH3 and multiple ankyrin repeat domains protein 2 isoform X2 [Condylostylus longicornis]
MEQTSGFDDDPPPEPRDGWLLVRIHVPELNVYKCLQFPADRLVWDVKQQVLASLPKVAFWFKELKESFNYGLFCPPSNGKAGKFLDEERRLGDYPFNGPVGYLELKYKRRVYKMLNLDERQLKALHTRANLRRFMECINGGHVEKIAKMCAKGLDPNFHCPESGETPLTVATGTKKPNKILIALVNGGALLDYRTKDGATALHKAVEKDSLEAVTTLLELGASPNYKDAKGLTPLYLSVTKKTDPKITESLLHDHATLGTQDNQGWQEVHQACRHGLVHHLEHLLFYGADMDGRNASGNTPLHVCAVNNQETCARMLLFRGAQRGALNYANQTPYQVAVIAGNLELAEVIQNYKSEDIDKSIGDTSDIISDSSGVGTNSDSAACSIGHPSTTVVCMEPYAGNTIGHIRIQPGEVIEVVGSTDCGLLEGYVRGTNRSGFFPAEYVQEVNIRQKNITNVSTASQYQNSPPPPSVTTISNTNANNNCNNNSSNNNNINNNNNNSSQNLTLMTQSVTLNGQYNSSTGPRIKKVNLLEPRTVILHRAKRGFGFVLRGAKASSPLMQLKPSERFPALQYLDDVDPGGVADRSGLKPGDFLLAINGHDVREASHEQVVDMIRSSGALVQMTVISANFPQNGNNNNQIQQHQQIQFQNLQGGGDINGSNGINLSSIRQCATLPRKMSGPGGRLPAPTPPRRDPKTTLSVGRARAKSMVAGLENGGEKDPNEDGDIPAKSSSIESISTSTPTQNPGTPVQLRTASIKARPTSSRITAAELEELFQRQQGEGVDGTNRSSTMMTTSRFQSGTDSGTATPPTNTSPNKGPLVYASVAEMKRKKSSKNGTLRGKPCAIPTVGADLKRNFHSTPDLHSQLSSSSSSIWAAGAAATKGHLSQDDVATLHASMQRLNLPPPSHPPPPPPVGQVVKVDVSRGSEYESTIALQKTIQRNSNTNGTAEGIASSFNPSTNAKLYASPQDLRNVAFRTKQQEQTRKNSNPRVPTLQQAQQIQTQAQSNKSQNTVLQQQPQVNQYAQPGRQMIVMPQQPATTAIQQPQAQQAKIYASNQIIKPQNNTSTAQPPLVGPAPPIPDPDYSLSESDEEDENSILVARNTKLNEKIALMDVPETSGNSNTSGSSTGSSSMPHSFSVDEIQKMRTKLKTSKSYPNDLKPENSEEQNNSINNNNRDQEEGDNSSSGVSSDQEIPTNNTDTIKKKPASNNLNSTTPASIISAQPSDAQHITSAPVPSVVTQPVLNTAPVVTAAVSAQQTARIASSTSITTAQQQPQQQQPIHQQLQFQQHQYQHQLQQQRQQHQQPQFIQQPVVTKTVAIKSVLITSSQNPIQKTAAKPLKIEPIPVNHLSKSVSIEQRSDDDGDLSPSPPANAFKRHNSLTRKQAAQIAMNRATRSAVSLVQLPPPIEADLEIDIPNTNMGTTCTDPNCPDNIVLAPPPQFCDCNDIKHSAAATGQLGHSTLGRQHFSSTGSSGSGRVRIIGTIPKSSIHRLA